MTDSNIAPPQTDQIPDPFDPASLRIDPGADLDVKLELTSIPVRRPGREWWFQVHPDPDFQLSTVVLELKEDQEVYLIDPSMRAALIGEPTVVNKKLLVAITSHRVLFIWPVRLPGPDGRLDPWSRSALEIAERAQTQWVRLLPSRAAGMYNVLTTEAKLADPDWSSLPTPREVWKLAFREFRIDSIEHPVIKRLRGAI